MGENQYAYSEDSRLLAIAIMDLDEADTFLEIGVGSASNLKSVARRFKLVVGTDLSIPSGLDPSKNRIELVVADRATCFRQQSFDVIVFNPPYLPSQDIKDRTVDGGEGGMEIPLKFLSSALEALKSNGKILALLSSLDSLQSFEEFCSSRGLSFNITKEMQLFFETLYVFEIAKKFQ
jgi:release factor glutamine methyltransferase